MKITTRRFLLVGAALLSSAGAARAAEGVVAEVNGVPILRSEYQKEIATSMDYWAKTNAESLKDPANVKKIQDSVLEELITRELLVQEGAKRNTSVGPRELDAAVAEIKERFKKDDATGRELSDAEAERAFIEQLRTEDITYAQFRNRLGRQVIARNVINEQVKAKLPPPDERTVRDYYDRIVDYLRSGSSAPPKDLIGEEATSFLEAAKQVKALSSERVRLQRILIRVSSNATEDERQRAQMAIADIKRRLDRGEDFAKVAKEKSQDPESAPRGGDVGYVLHGVSSPELEAAAFSMDIGQTSEPIRTAIGYNVIRVTEKRAAQEPTFDQFKDDLTKFIASVQLHKALEDYVAALRHAATITRYRNGVAATAEIPPAPASFAPSVPEQGSSGAGLSRAEIQALIEKAVSERTEAKAAAAPKIAHSDVDKPDYHAPERPDDYALVIGVEKYEGLPEASYAERDAQAVRAHLIALGYPQRNIVSLINQQASRSKMAAYLEDWLPRHVKADSRVFVYFSGHGAPNPETGQAYLVPSDGDPEFLEKTTYPTQRLYQQLGELKAKQVLVALDTCFSGAGGRSVLPKGIRPLVSTIDMGKLGSDRMVVLSASAGDQISGVIEEQGHGAFTYYLLKGLNGAAVGKKGMLTVQSLYGYLTPKVEDSARNGNRNQTPQIMPEPDRIKSPIVLR